LPGPMRQTVDVAAGSDPADEEGYRE